ncbi:hypothetical protein D9M69_552690 [compost metagenome]
MKPKHAPLGAHLQRVRVGKLRAAHADGNAPAFVQDLAGHHAASGTHLKFTLSHLSTIPKIATEDPQPVAAFLSLGTVGVVNGYRRHFAVCEHRHENTVRS